MKDDEHGKPVSGEKDEDSALVQVEENDRGKARKEAKDMEMVGTEDVVEKEAPDVKHEVVVVVREGEEEEKYSGGKTDKIVGDKEKGESLKRKRGNDHGPFETGEAKKNGDTKENIEELEVHGSRKRSKEVLSTPVVSPSDHPVRERKTVERLVEVIEKGPDRTVIIEKGRGTPLREIPDCKLLAISIASLFYFMHYDLISQICTSFYLFYHLSVLSGLDFQLLVALINYLSTSYLFVGSDIWLELSLMGLVLLFGCFL